MNTLNIVVPIVAAGLAIGLAGIARLLGIGLSTMPRVVAMAMVATGLLVAAFGLASPQILASRDPARVGLEQVDPPPPTPGRPVQTDSPPNGTITGTVTDAAGKPLPGATVQLRRFEKTDQVDAGSTVTQPDGTFSFDGLPTGQTDAYVVSTVFAQTTFQSDIIVLASTRNESVRLSVAEVTTDSGVVSIAVDSTVIAGDRSALQVLQILSVKVKGDRAYTAGLELPILDGASGFEPRRGITRMSLAFMNDRLVTTQPIPPGTTEIVYVYFLPGPADSAKVVRRATYPTERLELLSDASVTVESKQMKDAGAVRIPNAGDVRYRRLVARDLKPGQRITSQIGIAEPSQVRRNLIVGTGIAVAILILGLPLVVRRRRAPAEQTVEAQ